MQIRLSWQFLGALVIFLVALAILGRFVLSLGEPPPAAPTPSPALAEQGSTPARTSDAAPPAGAAADATGAATTAPVASAASVTPAASATPPPATATSSPEPTATATSTPEPTATTTSTPEPTATPEPAAVVLVSQGFGQVENDLGYGFIVRNPNPGLIARDVFYQLIVYDSAGIVLRTDSGSIPVVEGGAESPTAKVIELPDGLQATRVEVLIGGTQFVRSVPQPAFALENIAFVPGDPTRITGLIRNPLAAPLQGLPVVGLAFDAGGRIIGGGAGSVPFLTAGGQAAAEVIVAVRGEVASVQLSVRPQELLAP